MPAILFSAQLSEIFNSAAITGYYDTMQEDVRPYLGEALFPNTRTDGMELKSISGKAGPPVTLRPSAFDAVAPIRPRIPFSQLTNEMPFFREAMVIGEKDKLQLRMALRAGDQYARSIIDRIYDDQYHLLLGADVATERMRKELLATGFIKMTVDGVPYDYDYGFDPATQETTLVGTATWDNPETSNPIADLNQAKKDARLGSARVVMTEATYQNMLASKSVKGYMFAESAQPTYVLPDQIAAYITQATKCTFIVIDPEENTFRERVNGPDLQMFPDGVATLIPANGAIGETPHGITPEEADLMGEEDVDVTVTSAGVAVVTKTIDHPVNHETRVSQIALPVIERIDRMHIINVY